MDFSAILVIINIVVIEALLSLDNAAVLALLVAKADAKDRRKLMLIGIVLAYLFRVVALLLAFWLIKFWQLKLLGGLYLIYLSISHLLFSKKQSPPPEKENLQSTPEKSSADSTVDEPAAKGNLFTRHSRSFWSGVLSIGLMDLVFSVDNIFVVVALSSNIFLIWFGVLISIISLMLVVNATTKFIARYPALEVAVLYVVSILGIKLIVHSLDFLMPPEWQKFLETETLQLITSLSILATFIGIIVISNLLSRLK